MRMTETIRLKLPRMQHQSTHTTGFIGAAVLMPIPGCTSGLFIRGLEL